MKNHFKNEKTLVIVKPDGVQRSLIGEIMSRYEKMGLKLVAIKMLVATEEQVEKHYTLDSGWKKSVGEKSIEGYKKKGLKPPSEDPIEIANSVLDKLKKFMTSGPIVVMILQGAHAVEVVRKLTGATEPLSSDVGTIRGDFVMDSYQMADSDGRSVRNIVHASGTDTEAENETKHWFSDNEIVKYKIVQEKILYDVDWEGIFE